MTDVPGTGQTVAFDCEEQHSQDLVKVISGFFAANIDVCVVVLVNVNHFFHGHRRLI